MKPKEGRVFYQFTDGSLRAAPLCKREWCYCGVVGGQRVFWAWDRGLGAWIHYAPGPPLFGKTYWERETEERRRYWDNERYDDDD